MATNAKSHSPIQSSDLRQMSTKSDSPVETFKDRSDNKGIDEESQSPTLKTSQDAISRQRLFTLSIHEDSHSKVDVVLNASTASAVLKGALLQLQGLKPHRKLHGAKVHNGEIDEDDLDPDKHYLFCAKHVDQELLSKQPGLQVSVSRKVARAFDFEKGNQVLVSTADETTSCASHVEIVFRDQYLARADMWRLICAELLNTGIYRGQTVNFMESIKATIKTIFVRGRKVPSAFFDNSTKPIFRSESARYVLFIQMSKEMWDFDAEGTGEIMFDKVINGFLPELFKRWQEIKVKHLVSIVLFTRMIYEQKPSPRKSDFLGRISSGEPTGAGAQYMFQDFYRVVVSDMASGEWADILNQLKKEFKVFLRDISIQEHDANQEMPLGSALPDPSNEAPDSVIVGKPSAATNGNVLEAINLASSQFSSDYIDRDLVRTGVSVVVISPAAGVFEVDYNLLVATTDNLIDNGVGIDLVCLSRMPLHSVPLFKYRTSASKSQTTPPLGPKNERKGESTPTGSILTTSGSPTPPAVIKSHDMSQMSHKYSHKRAEEPWKYGIPHWVDISFWASTSNQHRKEGSVAQKLTSSSNSNAIEHKPFPTRVRMYELQMMGVMENAQSDIAIPQLSQEIRVNPSILHSLPMKGGRRYSYDVDMYSTVRSSHSHSIDSGQTTPRLATSFASSQQNFHESFRSSFQWMDEYDDLVFRHPAVARKRARKTRSSKSTYRIRPKGGCSPSMLSSSIGTHSVANLHDHRGSDADGESYLRKYAAERQVSKTKGKPQGASDASKPSHYSKLVRVPSSSRKISFGPRGLGIGATAAVASATTDHDAVKSELSRAIRNENTPSYPKAPGRPPIHALHIKETHSPSFSVSASEASHSSESDAQQSSLPIPIRQTTAARVAGDEKVSHGNVTSDRRVTTKSSQPKLTTVENSQEERLDLSTEAEDQDAAPPAPISLSPGTQLAPWLTILNPSNPPRTNAAFASRLGRWHHIFPKPLKTSQIKWKSLCSPAAVPLTTGVFPTAQEFAEEYGEISYHVDLPESKDNAEPRWSHPTELIAFRLSRGFQLVVGDKLTTSPSLAFEHLSFSRVFDGGLLAITGDVVFLVRGSIIHKLTRADEKTVEIKQSIRHEISKNQMDTNTVIQYKPLIRSMLADRYDIQEISIPPQKAHFDWRAIDSFIVGHQQPRAEDFVKDLRPWRARFVLIPVESSSSNRRQRHTRNEDDEEEIRLEGIKKLTQVWQRFRYLSPDEKRIQAPMRNKKDTNPLDILYQTRNPSAIVTAELDNVAEGDATGRPVQLLPESDLYQRSNFKFSELAATIQGDKGVRMLDRRWHLRLHYNCFIGLELTTWLLQNFKDVDTRDEAVDLGNELMKTGMFKHVEQRHTFRDGNYFYQIADEYRTAREPKGWWGRGKASVPATPMSEEPPRDISSPDRSRATSNTSNHDTSELSTPAVGKKSLSVALSKSLLYDVDHRKRSYRPELINLHYDRLHNPDNCYHIRVEWMNTTPKLIQEAVLSWATSVDRFGLRLVEVPLGEASSITSMHPFRAPYRVRLKQQPPTMQPQSYFDNISFTPQGITEKYFYQKAIMKHFNFVLDFEAASDYPPDVDVTYSWGKPDYKYPQYIHRSGVLIAQITNEGDFLLLANRLYNNRSVATHKQHDRKVASEKDTHRGPGFYRSPLHRENTRSSPSASPSTSPSLRATLDIATRTQLHPTNKSPFQTFPSTPHHNNSPNPHSPSSSSNTIHPESLTKAFEAFCSDVKALNDFYEEVLSKPSTPAPGTPLQGGKTPRKGPETPVRGPLEAVMESIPNLALPGGLLERQGRG
ncbi:vacuolar membrane-associated protein iml1 [Puttea exsequens]|nr:vacuolar membrane-associated protein iml1 [Puttea exsequens]